jgi:hypothetical protein
MSTRRLLPLVILGLTLLCTALALAAERTTRKTGARATSQQPRTFADASGKHRLYCFDVKAQ